MQTILLIDNCALTRECLSTILRAKGYQVRCAPLISAAKVFIAENAPDLMITELFLPDGNAIDLMRSLSDFPDTSKTRVCLLTEGTDKKIIIKAIELGASSLLLKSKFTIGGFLDQIANIGASDTSEQPINEIEPPRPTPQPVSENTAGERAVCFPKPKPAQDPAEALKDIKPIIARSMLKERLDELCELNTLGEPIARLLQEIDSPETTIDEVSDLLKTDQVIAMKVMRIANSSSYVRTEQTTTLKDAVIRIGLEHLRELVVSIGIIDQLTSNPGDHAEFDQRLFWEHALGVAACSSKIARISEDIDEEMAFTAGLLHDIGRVIMFQLLPEYYPQVLSASHELGVPLEQVEKRMLLTDHTSIVQGLLHSWNMPRELIDAITHHHCHPPLLPKVCPKNTRLAATVGLANQLVHALGLGCSGNLTLCPTEDLFRQVATEDLNIEQIIDGLDEEIREIRSLIYPVANPQKPIVDRVKQRRPVFEHVLSPVYLTLDPETDAIGHWVRSLGDQNQRRSNIAIVHARHPRNRKALGEMLEETQARYASDPNWQTLPVLILSPNGKTALPDEVLLKHPSLHLMTPFSVLHFQDAINHLLGGTADHQQRLAA